jgi:hypothetical protein
MRYQRIVTEEPKLAAEVKAWLDEAEAADQAEDARHARERCGDEMPEGGQTSGGSNGAVRPRRNLGRGGQRSG